jgi:hypothetical protein
VPSIPVQVDYSPYANPYAQYAQPGLGAGPAGPNFVPGAYNPGTFAPQTPVPASATGVGAGTILLSLLAVAAVGAAAWYSYKSSVAPRVPAHPRTSAMRQLAAHPARPARRPTRTRRRPARAARRPTTRGRRAAGSVAQLTR